MNERKPNKEIDARIGKVNAILRELYRSVFTKWELSNIAKLSVFKSVFVPILMYGHESWVMTERALSQVVTAEMGFLRRVHGVTLRDKVRSCEIRKAFSVEPLLQIERSQLRWCNHVSIMSQERFARQVYWPNPRESGPEVDQGDQVLWIHLRPWLVPSCCGARKTIWDYSKHEAFRVLLGLITPRPSPEEKRSWKWVIAVCGVFSIIWYANPDFCISCH